MRLRPRRNQRVQWRIGVVNILGWHHTQPGGKNAKMSGGLHRTSLMMRRAKKAGVTILVMAECEKIQADHVRAQFKNWDYVITGANSGSVGGRRGNWMATVIFYRSDLYTLEKAKDVTSRLGARTLHHPAALFRENRTAGQGWVLGTHLNRKQGKSPAEDEAYAKGREDAISNIEEFIADRQDRPVVVAGDVNTFSNPWHNWVKRGVPGNPHRPATSVDQIFGNDNVAFLLPVVDRSPQMSVITDHGEWAYVDARMAA